MRSPTPGPLSVELDTIVCEGRYPLALYAGGHRVKGWTVKSPEGAEFLAFMWAFNLGAPNDEALQLGLDAYRLVQACQERAAREWP